MINSYWINVSFHSSPFIVLKFIVLNFWHIIIKDTSEFFLQKITEFHRNTKNADVTTQMYTTLFLEWNLSMLSILLMIFRTLRGNPWKKRSVFHITLRQWKCSRGLNTQGLNNQDLTLLCSNFLCTEHHTLFMVNVPTTVRQIFLLSN